MRTICGSSRYLLLRPTSEVVRLSKAHRSRTCGYSSLNVRIIQPPAGATVKYPRHPPKWHSSPETDTRRTCFFPRSAMRIGKKKMVVKVDFTTIFFFPIPTPTQPTFFAEVRTLPIFQKNSSKSLSFHTAHLG